MKRKLILPACFIISFTVFAQAERVEDLERLDTNSFIPIENLEPLDVDKEVANDHIIQFGLATTVSYFYSSHLRSNEQAPIKNFPDESNGLFQAFLRPYVKYHLFEKYTLHSKAKFTYKHWDKQANYSTNPSEEPRQLIWGSMEELFAELRFGAHRVEAGRRFFRIGRGIVFNDFADGLQYSWASRYGRAKAFAAYSGDYGNCAISLKGCGDQYAYDPVSDRGTYDGTTSSAGKRMFLATEITSPRYWGGEAYLMGMYSIDMIDESKKTEKTAFNPWYAGIGLRGFIINANYRYTLEGIYAGGTTRDASTNSYKESNISAYAGIFEFKYTIPYFQHLLKPNLNLQYAIGSGEADKDSSGNLTTNNPTSDPVNKNISGSYQTFYYFGAYSGGLGLRPRLANLQAYRVGVSLKPLHFLYDFRNLGTVATFSIYRKVNQSGFISDTKAKNSSSKPIDSSDVGMAVDLLVLYNVSSELKIFYSFGLFKPGKAYPEKDANDNESGREVRIAHFISVTTIF